MTEFVSYVSDEAIEKDAQALLAEYAHSCGVSIEAPVGIDDIINCLKGDIGACVMAVIGNLPWGKIFKAKKIAEGLWRVGKAILKFIEDIKWAKAMLRGAEDAAKAVAAAAA